jgi:hypothetical protein
MSAEPGLRSAAACVPVVGALHRSRDARPPGELGPGSSRPLGGPRPVCARSRRPCCGRMEDRTPPYPVLPPRTPTFSSLGTPPCLQRATGADARDNSCDTHGHAQRSRPQCAWSVSIVVIPKDSANSDNSLAASTSFAAEITFSTYRTPFTISFICRVRFDIKGIHASNLKKISDIIRIATNL